MSKKAYGFTIVELLIVIVVIAILAAISIVAYRGIQDRARDSAITSGLSQMANKVKVDYATNQTYPTTLSDGGNSITYSITSNPNDNTFCITGVGDGFKTKSVDQSGQFIDGPCDGLSGGAAYCPDNSIMAINGYFCDGAAGNIPTGWSPTGGDIRKLLASDPEVPVGAPGYYVAKQTSRDAYSPAATMPASPGEIFCVTGWVTTASSAVSHSLGVVFTTTTGTIWRGTATTPASATGVWRKVNGCHTAPANTTAVRLWTQNDAGAYSAPVSVPWYQTAIVMTKQ